jgi:hypothetical protein
MMFVPLGITVAAFRVPCRATGFTKPPRVCHRTFYQPRRQRGSTAVSHLRSATEVLNRETTRSQDNATPGSVAGVDSSVSMRNKAHWVVKSDRSLLFTGTANGMLMLATRREDAAQSILGADPKGPSDKGVLSLHLA